jgi:hypothetical protein
MNNEMRNSIDKFKNFILVEGKNDYYSSMDVTYHIWNLLDHNDLDNDWDFNDYHRMIKRYGKKWDLITLDPNDLKFNEDFDDDMVEEYEDNIDNGIELSPVVVDIDNEIVDGNHRAKASLNRGKMILGYRPIPTKK